MKPEQRYTKEEMDKRDMFACAALQALISNRSHGLSVRELVTHSYNYADLMMQERVK